MEAEKARRQERVHDSRRIPALHSVVHLQVLELRVLRDLQRSEMLVAHQQGTNCSRQNRLDLGLLHELLQYHTVAILHRILNSNRAKCCVAKHRGQEKQGLQVLERLAYKLSG